MQISAILLTAFTILAPGAAFAQNADQAVPQPAEARPATTSAALTEGEVRRVDKEAGKITLRHGPIVNLDMPAMSMVFQVKDAALLDQVKAGDKIRFRAEKVGGQFVVTRIESAK